MVVTLPTLSYHEIPIGGLLASLDICFLPITTTEEPLAPLSATGQLCHPRAHHHLQDSRKHHLGLLQVPPEVIF